MIIENDPEAVYAPALGRKAAVAQIEAKQVGIRVRQALEVVPRGLALWATHTNCNVLPTLRASPVPDGRARQSGKSRDCAVVQSRRNKAFNATYLFDRTHVPIIVT